MDLSFFILFLLDDYNGIDDNNDDDDDVKGLVDLSFFSTAGQSDFMVDLAMSGMGLNFTTSSTIMIIMI